MVAIELTGMSGTIASGHRHLFVGIAEVPEGRHDRREAKAGGSISPFCEQLTVMSTFPFSTSATRLVAPVDVSL